MTRNGSQRDSAFFPTFCSWGSTTFHTHYTERAQKYGNTSQVASVSMCKEYFLLVRLGIQVATAFLITHRDHVVTGITNGSVCSSALCLCVACMYDTYMRTYSPQSAWDQGNSKSRTATRGSHSVADQTE